MSDKACPCCGAIKGPATTNGRYVIVPMAASDEMIEAAENVEDLYRRGTPRTWARVWRAMINAYLCSPKEGS